MPASSPQGGHNDVSEYFGHINISLKAVLPKLPDNHDREHSPVITLTPEPMLQVNVCSLGWLIDSNTVRSVSCVSLSFPDSANRWDRWKEPPPIWAGSDAQTDQWSVPLGQSID